MNPKFFYQFNDALLSMLSAGLGGVAQPRRKKEAKLQAEAKVTRADAEKTALSKAPRRPRSRRANSRKRRVSSFGSFDIAVRAPRTSKRCKLTPSRAKSVSVETRKTAAQEAKGKKGNMHENKK